MRSDNLLLLASLASHALALPRSQLENRGLVSEVGGLVTDVVEDLTGLIAALFGQDGQSPAFILTGISGPAAAALESAALGSKASVVSSHAREELVEWVKSHNGAHLEKSIKTALLKWADGEADATLPVETTSALSFFIPTAANIASKDNLFVTLDGVFSSVDDVVGMVLSGSAQDSLTAFLKDAGSSLEPKVKSALALSSSGGMASDLEDKVQSTLKEWLNSSDCKLTQELKKTVTAWLNNETGKDVLSLGSLPHGGLSTISSGSAIGSLVGEAGSLVDGAKATLTAILKSDVVGELDSTVKTALEACAKGQAATTLSKETRTSVVQWLADSSNKLGDEQKSLLIYWLSFANGGEVALNLANDLVSDLTSFLTDTIDNLLGTNLHGVLSLLTEGEAIETISMGTRAQLAALGGGAAGIELTDKIQLIIIQLITGCDADPASKPSGTSLPAISTPASSGAAAAAASSTPCDTLTSETVVPVATNSEAPDVQPTGASSAAASSTPCDTLTSETVVPVATNSEAPSSPDVQPTGASSAPASSSTPCDTLTSETVVPVATETDTPSAPAVQPTGTSSAAASSSTPCDTLTSETVVP
ncbi:putative cell wall protein, partial [Aspergillus candidus]